MSHVATLTTVTERYSTLKLRVSDGGKTQLRGPIEYTGSLDKYPHFDITSNIGRQYGPELQLSDFLDADEKTLRDLAATSGCSVLNGTTFELIVFEWLY